MRLYYVGPAVDIKAMTQSDIDAKRRLPDCGKPCMDLEQDS